MDLRQLREVVGVSYVKIYYCDECVGETLHYRDDTDGVWTCPSCGGWSA